MQTKPLPEIEPSDVKAARDFLTSFREEDRKTRTTRHSQEAPGLVKVHNGITRARLRSASKTSA